ncbi:tetratricopeptide repeat protein [Candidatus Riflebacteria bacterium]
MPILLLLFLLFIQSDFAIARQVNSRKNSFFYQKYNAGIKLIRQKHYKDAKEVFQDLFHQARENKKVVYLFGLCLFKTGEWKKAEPLFKKISRKGEHKDLVSIYLKEIEHKKREEKRNRVIGGRNIDRILLNAKHRNLKELKSTFKAAYKDGRPFIALRYYSRIIELDRSFLSESYPRFERFLKAIIKKYKKKKSIPLYKKYILALAFHCLEQDELAENTLLQIEKKSQFSRWEKLVKMTLAGIDNFSNQNVQMRKDECYQGVVYPGIGAFGIHLGDSFADLVHIWGNPARVFEYKEGKEVVYSRYNRLIQQEEDIAVVLLGKDLRVKNVEILASENQDYLETSLSGIRFWESFTSVYNKLQYNNRILKDGNSLKLNGVGLHFFNQKLSSLSVFPSAIKDTF